MNTHRIARVVLVAAALGLPAAAAERSDVIRRDLALPAGARTVEIDNVFGGVEVRGGAAGQVSVEIRRTASARREADLALAFEEVTLAVEEWPGGLALVQDGPFRCRARDEDGRRDGPEADDDEQAGGDDGELGGGNVRAVGRSVGRTVGRRVGRTVGRGVGRSWGRRHGWGDCRWDPDYDVDWQWTVVVPADVDLEVRTVNGGAIEVAGVRGALEVGNVNGPLRLVGLAGRVTAATVNGGIDAEFAVRPSAEARFETVNGEIEIALPAGSGAEVELETMNGELWSDFEVTAVPRPAESSLSRRGRSFRLEHDTVVRLGGGGPRFRCQTLNGDIVLRER